MARNHGRFSGFKGTRKIIIPITWEDLEEALNPKRVIGDIKKIILATVHKRVIPANLIKPEGGNNERIKGEIYRRDIPAFTQWQTGRPDVSVFPRTQEDHKKNKKD